MAGVFNGVDSYIYTPSPRAWPNPVPPVIAMTFAVWMNPTSYGGGNAGGIYGQGWTGDHLGMLKFSTTGKLRFSSTWSGGLGVWEMTNTVNFLNAWWWIAAVYQTMFDTHDPTLYLWNGTTLSVLTVGSGLTRVSQPNGAVNSGSKQAHIGVAGTPSDYPFAGRLAEIGAWPRMLSIHELLAVMQLGVLAVPDVFDYFPVDIAGNLGQNLGASRPLSSVTANNLTFGQPPPYVSRLAGRPY